ncbi:hypothetical protein CCZ01_02215 [Helicobacter monodelphidis]|uniref:DUF2156 domain-containing protein n=1 Tax=Helicobacter sp. 15-1451 TaxID=2004995 RepID=UPI000DCDAB4E|nr:phosphatidylglycerol lysyltransferase domain-containing protein [Helicobacter sp. 15-1451]RAX58622.1 hypothetical protein CCZ01_02215 [Helicobacter sp. 15-1451]
MNFKPISLADKDLIEKYQKEADYEISDISFTNLFLWSFSRSISFCEIHDTLCIQTTYPQQKPFLFLPLGKGDKKAALEEIIAFYQSQNLHFSIHSLSQQMKEELEQIMPNRFTFTYNRDRSDYVYSIQELVELKGRKFHKKKNHLNRFYEEYPNFSYRVLNISNRFELIEVWNNWFSHTQEPTQGLKNEYIGILNALENFENMNFTCGILYVNDEIIAFSLGEPLNHNSVVIHIEKANISYHGAYQAINQLFLEKQWQNYEWVNREEDLGIEGLRKAKMSYHPAYLVEKFDGFLI